jgi:hypothetical protein
MIGGDAVLPELRVGEVIGAARVSPNDPRIGMLNVEVLQAAENDLLNASGRDPVHQSSHIAQVDTGANRTRRFPRNAPSSSCVNLRRRIRSDSQRRTLQAFTRGEF